MLDKMIESRNDSTENFRRSKFLLTTLCLVTIMFSGAMLYSIYAKPLGMMNGDLEISSLTAPVIATEPPAVEPMKKETNNLPTTKTSTVETRVVNQKRIDESPDIPTTISITKNQNESRPTGRFQLGPVDSKVASSNSGNGRESVGDNANGIIVPSKQENVDEETKEPPKMPKVEPKPTKPIIKSIGVANGMAKNLPKPAYPLAAKAVHAQGAVDVQIVIDESGKVVSAKAVSGHPLLRQAAEQAAQHAIFSPTLLSNVPVKATGVIVYNFVSQ